MADIERVWGEEERAKLNRTLTNKVRMVQDIDQCALARNRIIALMREVKRLEDENALLKKAGGAFTTELK